MVCSFLMTSIHVRLQLGGAFYDPKSNHVLKSGFSRPNGYNTYHTTRHAEIQAIKCYHELPKQRKVEILIWRSDRNGVISPAFCCLCCKKSIFKNGLQDKIFTFNHNKKISAIIEHPQVSKGMKILFNLQNAKKAHPSKTYKQQNICV